MTQAVCGRQGSVELGRGVQRGSIVGALTPMLFSTQSVNVSL